MSARQYRRLMAQVRERSGEIPGEIVDEILGISRRVVPEGERTRRLREVLGNRFRVDHDVVRDFYNIRRAP